MGNYYKAVCIDKMESIDPGVLGYGIKERAIYDPGHPMGRLLLAAIFFGRWSGCRIDIVCDEADMGEPGDYHDRNLKDVTREVVADHNRRASPGDKIVPLEEWRQMFAAAGEDPRPDDE